MKILVFGDIHGRTLWKDIFIKELPDFTIFLGDYITSHENISADIQISNLEDILKYKEDNLNKVILLRGNHDLQHLGYYWADCSGLTPKVWKYMTESSFKERFLKLTQWVYIDDNLKAIFSHAGVSQVWMDNNYIKSVKDINKLEPSEIFGFTPNNIYDFYGNSVTQPPVWIRPQSLCKCNVKEYSQVVGHTPSKKIVDMCAATINHEHIWLCDTLNYKEYLLIEDSVFKPKILKMDNQEKMSNLITNNGKSTSSNL